MKYMSKDETFNFVRIMSTLLDLTGSFLTTYALGYILTAKANLWHLITAVIRIWPRRGYWKMRKCATSLQWRHNRPDGVSNHMRYECLLNRVFRRRSKKISKLRVTSLCAENSPVTGEFPAQKASNAEIFSFDDVIMISTGWKSSPPGSPV